MSITGHPDGPPAKVGVAVTDLLTGSLTAGAILAAMQNSGPTWVKASLFHTQSAMLSHIGNFKLFCLMLSPNKEILLTVKCQNKVRFFMLK